MLWKISLTKLTQQKATCSPLSEFNNLRSWQFFFSCSFVLDRQECQLFCRELFCKVLRYTMSRVVWTEHRPKLKFQTDQLAERISWTMAGLPTRTVVDTISRIWKSRHHISTPKKLMEMFPSNPSQSPHPKHWHLRVYCHGGCGLAKFVQRGGKRFETQQWREMSRSIFCIQRVGDENQPFSVLKKIQQIPPISVWGSRIFLTLGHPTFQGWMILFLFVIVCAWKFPPNLSQSPHPKTLAPQCLLAQQLQPSKGVQSSCRSRWHRGTWFETQQFERAVIKSMFYTSNDEKPTHFLPKKARKCRKCRRRLPRLRAAAGAHCSETRNCVGERSWWQNKWWKSMERWGIYGNFPLISINMMATRYIIYIMIL